MKVSDLVNVTLGEEWGSKRGSRFVGLIIDHFEGRPQEEDEAYYVYVFEEPIHIGFKTMWLDEEEVEAL